MVEASHSVPCVRREQLLGLPVPTDASKREQLHWGLGFLTCIFVEVSDLNKLWLKTTHVILMDFLEVLVAGEWNSENRISLLLWRCGLFSLGFLLASGSVAACEEEYSVCMGIGVQKRWKWLLWWVLPYSPLLCSKWDYREIGPGLNVRNIYSAASWNVLQGAGLSWEPTLPELKEIGVLMLLDSYKS